MKKVIVIAVAVLLLLSCGAVSVMYYIGDSLIDAIVDSELSAIQEGTLPAVPEKAEDGGSAPEGKGENPGAAAGKGNGEANVTEAAGEKAAGRESGGKQPVKGKPEKSILYTPEQINGIKDHVSAEDKIAAAALLLKRLSASDIDELKGMLENGVDKEEKKRAREIIYQRFDEKEIQTIKGMYEKYMSD